MSDSVKQVEEMLAAINQYIEYNRPEAAKFLEFTIVSDEEPYILVQIPGIPLTKTKLNWGYSRFVFMRETCIDRLETGVSHIIAIINIILNGLHMCEKCVGEISKYRRFVATIRTHTGECSSHTPANNLAIANILEPSLERQEHVADTLRPLPLPISQEIMLYFVA